MSIETYRPEEFHNPNSAVIAGIPEQIGLTQAQVTAGLLCSKTPEAAFEFVTNYYIHVKDYIDLEHKADAKNLAKRHLIDQLYYTHLPTEANPNHPANLKVTESKRLVVSAMIDLLEDDTEIVLFNIDWPPDRVYREMKEEILSRRESHSRLA